MDENVNGTETTLEEIVGEMAGETETSSVTADAVPPSPEGKALGTTVEAEPKALPLGEGVERSETGEVPPAGDAPGDRKAELVRGIEALAADGWTSEELRAFSQDEQAAKDIAEGRSLESTALRYMRRARSAGSEDKAAPAPAKRSVPTMRSAGAGETDAGDPIARMSDREFDAFYARAMEKAMTGAKVRI